MKRLAWIIALVLPIGALAGEVYRSVGKDGVVVYSDRPSKDATAVIINVLGGASRAPAAGKPAAKDNEPAPGSEVAAEIPREPTPDEIAADRARNCDYARQMQTTYSTAHRLFRNGPNGEREYLSDAEIDEKRAKAESEVAKWCD